MSETAERKTPLYETHKKYKGKIVDRKSVV